VAARERVVVAGIQSLPVSRDPRVTVMAPVFVV